MEDCMKKIDIAYLFAKFFCEICVKQIRMQIVRQMEATQTFV